MSKFDTCKDIGNLWQIVHDQYGKWGDLNEDAAEAIIAAVLEERHPVKRRVTLMAMLAITWMNESCFNFDTRPNTNGQPSSPWHYDVGFLQMNVQWTHRMVWQGELDTTGLVWHDVWGTLVNVPFDGNVIAHARCGLRRLLATKGDDETRVVRYTGPVAQPHRLADWRKYEPLFIEFFQSYLT
jgi:hypothetical protein